MRDVLECVNTLTQKKRAVATVHKFYLFKMTVSHQFFRPFAETRPPLAQRTTGASIPGKKSVDRQLDKFLDGVISDLIVDVVQIAGLILSITCDSVTKSRSMARCLGIRNSIMSSKYGLLKYSLVERSGLGILQLAKFHRVHIFSNRSLTYLWMIFMELHFCFPVKYHFNWSSLYWGAMSLMLLSLQDEVEMVIPKVVTKKIGYSREKAGLFQQITVDLVLHSITSILIIPLQVLITALIFNAASGNQFTRIFSLGSTIRNLGCIMLEDIGYRSLSLLAFVDFSWVVVKWMH